MDINGFSSYTIYNDGRIYSKKRNIFLKHIIIPHGYLVVMLRGDQGNTKYKQVHKLVAEHFVLNPNNYEEIDHIDRITSNCHYTNLIWTTHIINCQNKSFFKNNKSGHSNICIPKTQYRFQYSKNSMGLTKQRAFNNLTNALCYKFIQLLEIKADLFNNSLMIIDHKRLKYKVKPEVIKLEPVKLEPVKLEPVKLERSIPTYTFLRCDTCKKNFINEYFFNKHTHHKKKSTFNSPKLFSNV